MDYNARYYDPALGTFISPDSIVPGAGQLINYNRFLYARGNPLEYSDPTGHDPLGPEWVEAFKAAHGGQEPTYDDEVARTVSVTIPGSWPDGSWMDKDWIWYAKFKETADWFIAQTNESAASDEFGAISGSLAAVLDHINATKKVAESAESLLHLFNAGGARLEAYRLWIQQVGKDRPWNFKVQEVLKTGYLRFDDYGYERDICGNIHYGFIGAALGF